MTPGSTIIMIDNYEFRRNYSQEIQFQDRVLMLFETVNRLTTSRSREIKDSEYNE